MEAYFPTTVHVGGCPGWYKAGKKDNRVATLWAGSGSPTREMLEYPSGRTEVAIMRKRDGRLSWLGDGWLFRLGRGVIQSVIWIMLTFLHCLYAVVNSKK